MFGNHVKLSEWAFTESQVYAVKFGNKCGELPDALFANCHMLEYVHFPTNMSQLPANMFACAHTNRLPAPLKVDIPAGLTHIHEQAFMGSGITFIHLPSLKKLGNYAFRDSQLTSIDVPRCAKFGVGVFYHTPLVQMRWNSANPTIPPQMFEHTRLNTVILPPGDVRIETRAFADCCCLNTIFISETVEFIAADAFDGCVHLTDVALAKNVTPFVEQFFSDTAYHVQSYE